MEQILRYFPELSAAQIAAFEKLFLLYKDWNEKINVISRKDIDNFYERHVLHSLAIAKYEHFKDGTKLMDLGTGGGFPGVPLAILLPNCRFHLVDSIGKKLKVIDAVAENIGLKNIKTFHSRAEQMPYQYDFVVSRAVAPLTELLSWTKKKYADKDFNQLKNGLVCLKGGDLTAELKPIPNARQIAISDYFKEDFFSDKSIVYVQQ